MSKTYDSPGKNLVVALSGRSSGDIGVKGDFAGVCLTDTDANGNVVLTTENVHNLFVEAATGGGPSAVAFGDPIYASDSGAQNASSTVLSKDSSGTKIGHAVGAVTAGSIGKVGVRLIGAKPGIAATIDTPDLADGSVTTGKLDGGAVDETKLKGALAKGFIPLDLTTVRIIAANAVGNTTEGGLPDGNTSPSLARVDGATDRALRLIWAAGATEEIQFAPIPKPPDLDDGEDLTVHLLLAKDTNDDDAAVVGVAIFDGVGDTDAGGNTAALDAAALAEKTVTMAHADLAAAPGFLNVSVAPGAHANDAIYLYAAWIEYARKG